MARLPDDTSIHHFSHPHPLRLSSSTQNQQSLIPLSCAACTLPSYSSSSSLTYSCNPCNFLLHFSCAQHPPLINHPSHPTHPLTLLPIPAYPAAVGYFNCYACGCNGTGFSYHCGACSVNLHTACASMPLSVNHYAHAHPLTLTFFPPYYSKRFSCDVCENAGENHWLYRCASCEFDVHLGCMAPGGARVGFAPTSSSVSFGQGVSRTGSGTLFGNLDEHDWLYRSAPTSSSVSFGRGVSRTGSGTLFGNLGEHHWLYGSAPMSSSVSFGRGVSRPGSRTLFGNIVSGVVNGATNQIGRDLVHGFMGGDDNGDGDGDEGGSSIFDDLGGDSWED